MTARRVAWLALAVLIVLYVADFCVDVRHRDAFSWMDPYQYYNFAQAVAQGDRGWTDFELPSIFPLLAVPLMWIEPSIPGALWINVLAMLLIVVTVVLLCRALELTTPPAAIVAVVMASPLLLGLSRSLYVELLLTGLVALGFVLWLRMLTAPNWANLGLLAGWFALGLLTKMTYPLFFLLPFLGVAAGWLSGRRYRCLARLTAVLAVAGALVLWLEYGLFGEAFGYYLSLGNTTFPIMRRIGPRQWHSWDSLTYYWRVVGTGMLLWITPLLAIPAVQLLAARKSFRPELLAGKTAALWLWFAGPLLLLVFQPVKEPRHVAPCVVPAVLLIFWGIERLASVAWRRAAVELCVVLAIGQYLAIALHWIYCPYLLDGPLHIAEIRKHLFATEPRGAIYRQTPAPLRPAHWAHTRNFVIAGFDPNEALALTWQFVPGVVYNLDILDDHPPPAKTLEPFEDLYFQVAFNTYNARAGWPHYDATLPRSDVLANADVAILKNPQNQTLQTELAHLQQSKTIATEDGEIVILTSPRSPTESYRLLFARRFLAANPSLSPVERNTVGLEILYAATLRGDFAEAQRIMRENPALRDPTQARTRNIYWASVYQPLHEQLAPRMFRRR